MTDVVETSSAITATPGRPGRRLGRRRCSPAPRLEQFEAEIARLKVKGGRADRERVVVILAVLATVAGFVVTAIGITGVRNASDQLEQGDSMSVTILGVGIAIVGVVVWARCSLSRYLRYWLVRDLYEQRASTDRIVEAIERQSPK